MIPRRPRTVLHVVLLLVALAGAFWQAPALSAGGAQARDGKERAALDSPKNGRRQRPAGKRVRKAKPIRNEYIVVLDDEVIGEPGEGSPAESLADGLVAMYGGKVKRRFKHALNAFTATMTDAQAAAMSEDVLVAYVEENSEVNVAAVQTPTGSWGIDRIDQRPRTRNNSYAYTYTGSGVTVYVVDSGIATAHVEFGGRAFAQAGWDFMGDGRNGQDCHGHGSHVAGTIGGSTVGVAKHVTLVSVRILNCQGGGSIEAALAAVNAITAYGRKPAVVNMSVEVPGSYALDDAVTRSINAGFTYVVAAGNSGVDACTVSPARAAGTIAAGASDWNDQRAIFTNVKSSNWGACVDVWAPGLAIISAAHTSTTGLVSLGGTSMASPHVAGAAAIYLSAYPGSTAAAVRSVILNTATVNALTGIGSTSPNRLLFSPMHYGY